jgi:hypothetical protein
MMITKVIITLNLTQFLNHLKIAFSHLQVISVIFYLKLYNQYFVFYYNNIKLLRRKMLTNAEANAFDKKAP